MREVVRLKEVQEEWIRIRAVDKDVVLTHPNLVGDGRIDINIVIEGRGGVDITTLIIRTCRSVGLDIGAMRLD